MKFYSTFYKIYQLRKITLEIKILHGILTICVPSIRIVSEVSFSFGSVTVSRIESIDVDTTNDFKNFLSTFSLFQNIIKVFRSSPRSLNEGFGHAGVTLKGI